MGWKNELAWNSWSSASQMQNQARITPHNSGGWAWSGEKAYWQKSGVLVDKLKRSKQCDLIAKRVCVQNCVQKDSFPSIQYLRNHALNSVPSLGFPSTRKIFSILEQAQKTATKNVEGACSTSYQRRARRKWDGSDWEMLLLSATNGEGYRKDANTQ